MNLMKRIQAEFVFNELLEMGDDSRISWIVKSRAKKVGMFQIFRLKCF